MRRKSTLTHILDVSVILALVLAMGYIGYRLTYSLNYKWNWSIIPDYLIRFDEQSGWTSSLLLKGLYTTIRLSIWGTLLAALLGLVIGLMRISSRLLYKLISRSYVELIRNMPPLVLVFIFYFFISDQILPLLGLENALYTLTPRQDYWLRILAAPPEVFPQFLSGVITLALFQGAYIAEIVRAGIQAIDRGQWEASAALGLSTWKQMRHVILPQATKIVLPPLANEFINTIKYSSIVSIISIQELTFQGMQVMASTQVTIEVWLTISLMYLLLCLILSLGVNWLEHRMHTPGHQ